MRLRYLVQSLCFVVASMLLVSCATPPKETGEKSAPEATKAPAEDTSTEASDRRTEAHARYANAILYDINEEPEKAAEEFYQAALTDPGDADLVLEATQRLLQLKEAGKAREVLLKATRQKDAPGILFAQLGRVYAIEGKKELAIDADRAAIRKLPDSLLGYRNLAQLYLQGHQTEQGIKVLDEAAKRRDPDAGFLIELAELYTAFGRSTTGAVVNTKSQSLECLTRAAKLKPNNPLLMKKLADGFALLGEPEKATEIYLKLVERFPQLPGLREKLTELYLRKEDRKKAAEQLNQLVRNNPTNPNLYYLLGSIAYEEKDPTNAIEYFNKTILLNGDFEQAYYDLAGAQINANKSKDALETLEKARNKFQESFVGEFFSALACSHMKDFTNAIKHLTSAEMIARVTDTNRLNHLFYFQLGAAFERSHNIPEAEKNFRKSLNLNPEFAEALNYLGYMWAERGENLTEARQMIEKAVKLEPKNAAYLDSMGWVLLKMGKAEQALEFLLKSIENSEEPDATLFDHLGDCYSALRQTDKARDAWRKSLAIEPNEQIQKKLGESASANRPQ
jgi:tetratricopeptide (TPR) repeat protein